ncbi:hypothetical protein P152DRAFT_18503 [Eremomyces bilateralis CBS 781.70]|uniref:Uncharacterized protein n=1 Tax=Eremomyces bilateralis CBS 781.70 TaxID=1392243 RepID=A0A6G1GH37_9PEZI|nr:uncharacterized protein P152DRAFT_18503 [Eremomyces bilateralis CBS 781.70]KAF1817417.1 hypothetical protein P152DRAFT_18503 [Eremomyces bilateralis CBS 781.70]
MAKKKKDSPGGDAENVPNATKIDGQSRGSKPSSKSLPPLLICRNKHWRYISAYHGPWLQLPPEILETIAHSNYLSPRPRTIDPAVCFDLVKIRNAVDEASNLAVRAASGLTSAAMSSSANFSQGVVNRTGAAALGLGYNGHGSTELSRERKYRMREMAARQLAHAYRTDEIATSVATMQATSTIDEVAHLVLQRNSDEADAKYVHFFHEKIPSRMMAQHSPLDVLDDVSADCSADPAPLRTRALVRIFKEDYAGAARDFTAALKIYRHHEAQHRANRSQLVRQTEGQEQRERLMHRDKIEEVDQPSSLEGQLLFHRAYVYLALACQHVYIALEEPPKEEQTGHLPENSESSSAQGAALQRKLEAQTHVRTYARRAIRDLVSFLNLLDYTPGLAFDVADRFVEQVLGYTSHPVNGSSTPQTSPASTSVNSEASSPDSLAPYRKPPTHRELTQKIAQFTHENGKEWVPKIYSASALFSPTPPSDLPPFPLTSARHRLDLPPPFQESLTFHPLLTEALHSLLLAHSLAQTPPTELRRHAHNVARLSNLVDGYPVFATSTRCPARADWVELLNLTNNWLDVATGAGGWEGLCRLSSVSDAVPSPSKAAERDGRTHAVATAKPCGPGGTSASAGTEPSRKSTDNGLTDEIRKLERDEPMLTPTFDSGGALAGFRSSERVDLIARWVVEIPEPAEGAGKGRKARGGKKGRKMRRGTGDVDAVGEMGKLKVDEGVGERIDNAQSDGLAA